jgi:hypothetical protein
LEFQIKEDCVGRAVAQIRGDEKHVKILFGQPESKKPFKTLRHRWVDSIRMDQKEIDLQV